MLDVVLTNYGGFYSAKRKMANGTEWHRVNQFIFSFHTMITLGDRGVTLRSFVPLDDHHAMLITHPAHPRQPSEHARASQVNEANRSDLLLIL